MLLVDLRLLGFTNRDRPFSRIAEEMLPLTWVAFAIAATAGLLMFSSKALIYYGNIPFRIKMLCLALAGLNMLWFHWMGARHMADWGCEYAADGGKTRRRRLGIAMDNHHRGRALGWLYHVRVG